MVMNVWRNIFSSQIDLKLDRHFDIRTLLCLEICVTISCKLFTGQHIRLSHPARYSEMDLINNLSGSCRGHDLSLQVFIISWQHTGQKQCPADVGHNDKVIHHALLILMAISTPSPISQTDHCLHLKTNNCKHISSRWLQWSLYLNLIIISSE